MSFKIGDTQIIISFTFFAIILFLLVDNESKTLLICLISAILHECVHLLFLFIFKSKIKQITLNLFGGNILRSERNKLSNLKEGVICLSAPIFNVIIGLIFYKVNRMNLFSQINIFIGIFNLLPFYNFDGGIALSYLTKSYLDEKNAQAVEFIASLFVIIFFSVFSFLVSKNAVNISIFIVNFYLIVIFVYKIILKR